MKYDKKTFKEVLEPHHRTYWKIAYTKLQRKMQSLKSSLKKRSEISEVIFDIRINFVKCFIISMANHANTVIER